MNSADRLLGILRLFTVAKPVWTVEDAAKELGVSLSQTYRYFNSLVKAGLLDSAVGVACFTLGPAFLEYDRQIRLCDPMLTAARQIMDEIARHAPEAATVLLCRRYHDRVMCVHQVVGPAAPTAVPYQRGRPMPILHGAASKAILAHLSSRHLKRLFRDHQDEIAKAGLGTSWEGFRNGLGRIRRQGYAHSVAEVEPGGAGISAPVFDEKGVVMGSLGFALPADGMTDSLVRRLAALSAAAAQEIQAAMTTQPAVPADEASPLRATG